MYSVSKLTHDRYGPIIHIERVENGSLTTPFQAVQAAMKERRLGLESGLKKVRILVDDKVMSPKQAEHWAHNEYISLPKCEGCAKILNEDVHQHQLSGTKFFCSKDCADRDYAEQIEKRKDEEEIDYL